MIAARPSTSPETPPSRTSRRPRSAARRTGRPTLSGRPARARGTGDSARAPCSRASENSRPSPGNTGQRTVRPRARAHMLLPRSATRTVGILMSSSSMHMRPFGGLSIRSNTSWLSSNLTCAPHPHVHSYARTHTHTHTHTHTYTHTHKVPSAAAPGARTHTSVKSIPSSVYTRVSSLNTN